MTPVLHQLFRLFLLLSFICRSSSFLTCLDENGSPVDSWIALAQNAEYQYYFHDPVNGFIKSPYRTNQTSEGSIMSTVAQLYSQDLELNNVAYALYNDDPPPPLDVASSTYAHSKGVVLFDHESGFWLVHSKPNWPNQRSGGPIPFPDSTYAQSLMCITMNSSMFDTVASGFLINYPYIYDSYMSANLESQLPIFKSWIAGGKSTVTNMTYEITSRAGKPFLQFAKSKSWGRDLYDDFVAPVLNESIFVETWRSGSGGRMGSVCENSDDDTWTVHPISYNIIEVSLVTMPDGDSWKGTSDHSKWVSTIDSGAICIGDINRMCSQESRGGGTVCVTDPTMNLWNSFNNAITEVEDCWAYNPCAGSSTQCYWCPSKAPTLKPTLRPSVATEPTISAYPTIQVDVVVGDVALVLIDSDNPDTFSVVALSTLPSGYAIKFTDNAWTGSALKTNEGTLQFTTSMVISAGSMWSYDGTAMTNNYGTWTKIQGTFSLATTGDQILVYSGDSSAPYFLFGLSLSPWAPLGTTLDTSNSVLPSSLANAGVNASVYFNDIDNAMYTGQTSGTQNQLQNWICNSMNWLTSDNTLYSPSQLQTFSVIQSLPPTISPTRLPTLGGTTNPTNIFSTLTVNERTMQCYSNCSYPGMPTSPRNWNLEDYCEFYSSTSCSVATVSSYSCSPSCLLDCVDVFCDTMASLVFLCDPSVKSSYRNKSLVQSSCLDSYSLTSPTKTLMTFLASVTFENVDSVELNTIESKEVSIVGMEMSLSGVTAKEIEIESIVGKSISSRRALTLGSLSSAIAATAATVQYSTNVTYKFSVILESLGYDVTSASSAYHQITDEITSSVVNGNLQQNLKAAGVIAGVDTFSSLTITSLPHYTSPVLTAIETASPSSLPTSISQRNSGGDGSNSGHVPTPVFYVLGGVGGLAIIFLGLLMALKSKQRQKKRGTERVSEIETRGSEKNPMGF